MSVTVVATFVHVPVELFCNWMVAPAIGLPDHDHSVSVPLIVNVPPGLALPVGMAERAGIIVPRGASYGCIVPLCATAGTVTAPANNTEMRRMTTDDEIILCTCMIAS